MGELKDVAANNTAKDKKGNLKSFIKDQSRYVTLVNDVPFVSTWKGYETAVDPRDPEKHVVIYTFIVDGKEKKLTSGSTRLARKMAEIEENSGVDVVVEIIRTGKGFDTMYQAKVVD